MKIILLLFITGLASASETKKAELPPNCFIKVTSTFKTGTTKERVFKLHEPTETDCKNAAKLHETNFAPQAISKKSVKYTWKQ